MYRALLTVVLSVCITSTSAATSPVPASTAAPRQTAARITLQPEAKIKAKAQAQAQAQALKVNTKLAERQSLRPPPPSTSNESTAGDSRENPYAPLLITLVLMGAIALRRRGSGWP